MEKQEGMMVDEKSIRRKLYEAANINGYLTYEQAATIVEEHEAAKQPASGEAVVDDLKNTLFRVRGILASESKQMVGRIVDEITRALGDEFPKPEQPDELFKFLEEMRTRTKIIRRDADALNVVQFQSGEVLDLIQQAFEHLPKREASQPVDCPSESEIASLVTDLWKLIKPSQTAQEIRSSIKLDSGKYEQPEVDFIPSYVWDLVDVAAEIGLTKREYSKPTEAMCNQARGFIMGLDLGCRTWGTMQEHLDMGGYPTTYYIKKKAKEEASGHITKWDAAECIYRLMEGIGLYPDLNAPDAKPEPPTGQRPKGNEP